MIKQVFMNFRVQKSDFFQYATFCSLFYKILHIFFIKTRQKYPGKFTSQLNLMPGQNLTPEKPDARLSVPTFIRDLPSPLPIYMYVTQPHMLHCLQIFIWAVDKENKNEEFKM